MNKRKKILMIGNLPGKDPRSIGGANTYTNELFKRLSATNEIEINFLQIRNRWSKVGLLTEYLFFPFRFIMRFFRCDTISIHATWDFHLTLGPFVVIISKAFKKKVIYHFFGGNFHNLFKKSPLLLQKWLEITILKSDYKLMETKRMISYFKRKELKNFVWFPNSREPIRGKKASIKFDKKFVFISRVTPTKGIDYLIEVAENLPYDYTFDVYGPLDYSFYNLHSFDNKRVNYKGVLDPEAVIDTLSNYNVLILPTFHEGEGYPGIFIEAMSIGMPIVSTQWNAIDELIEDKFNGVLIPIKSKDSLHKAVMLFNEENYHKMSKNALLKFESFNIKKVSKTLIDLYN